MSRPHFTIDSFFEKDNWIYLSEKGRGQWRLIPVHPRVFDLIKILEQKNRRLKLDFGSKRVDCSQLPTKNALFWIGTENKTALPLNHVQVINSAANYRIKYPDVKSNSYRHLMRSWLAENDYSHKIADFVLGHLQRGPHPLDELSSLPMQYLAREFLHAAGETVGRVGTDGIG